jgi:hypothetical protein
MSIGPGRHEIAWTLSLPARNVLVLGQRSTFVAFRRLCDPILVTFYVIWKIGHPFLLMVSGFA